MAQGGIATFSKRNLASFLSPIIAIRASNSGGEYNQDAWDSVLLSFANNDKRINNEQLFGFAQLYSYCQVIA